MNIIIFCALIWAICKLFGAASRRAKENARQCEIERLREEQARQRMEQQRQREAIRQRERDAKEQARKQAEHDKAIAKAAKEREAMRKEQERQAAAIAKHDAEIEKLKRTVEKAEFDIGFLLQRVAELDSQLDYLMIQQAGTIPGSKAFEKYQNQIVAKHKQIYTAESQLNKAQYAKAQAAAKLNA